MANEIRESLTSPMQLATDLAREKGASSWLTALPLEEHGFALPKTAFQNCIPWCHSPSVSPHRRFPQTVSVAIRFRCNTPSSAPEEATLNKAQWAARYHSIAIKRNLPRSGHQTIQQNHRKPTEWCPLDVVANGFWGSPFERAFFDVRVFNPFAPSNRHSSLSASYRPHENLKKRHYEQRIREVEHSSFTPLAGLRHHRWPWPSSDSLLQTPSLPACSRTNGSNHTAPPLAG